MSGLAAGCSNRAWYEGMRDSAERECVKTREECSTAPSYDEYEQQRETLKK